MTDPENGGGPRISGKDGVGGHAVNDNALGDEAPSAVIEPTKPRLFELLGPGLVTGASDDDPSGIATYSQAGAQFGLGLSWSLLFTYPLMSAVQIISARIGRTTGHGIAGNLRRHYPNTLLQVLVGLLIVANTINIGADLGAMADAARLLVGGNQFALVFAFAGVSIAMQILLQYQRYVSVLKWLAATLLAYVICAVLIDISWRDVLKSLVVPRLQWNAGYLTALVAILGTTISPYLFFWQASQEVEDLHEEPRRKPLVKDRNGGVAALGRIRLDTMVGMAISNLIALAILISMAAVAAKSGASTIETSAQAAEALRPVAGPYAFALFAAGVIGTGLLAVPVLAGSAAYAVGEARQWPVGLGRRPLEARAFYGTIAVATALGTLLNLAPINPIQALFWSAVLNGVVAVPVMAAMMLMARRSDVMGRWVIGRPLQLLGWTATLIMTLCVSGMLVLSLLPRLTGAS